jgi:hypothetical protein
MISCSNDKRTNLEPQPGVAESEPRFVATPRGGPPIRTMLGSIAVAAAGFLTACGSPSDPDSVEPASSSSQDLNAVLGCQADAAKCSSSGSSPSNQKACDAALHSCLAALLAEGGSPWSSPGVQGAPRPFEAGAQMTAPGTRFAPPSQADAGFTLPSLPDAGFTLPSLPGTGFTPPSLPDAGFSLPSLPNAAAPGNPSLSDGGAPSLDCLSSLGSCLFSQASATQCAEQARSCWTAAAQDYCDAREKLCLDTGAPQNVCSALRQTCR